MKLAPPADAFFADLPVIAKEVGAFDLGNYSSAPDNWSLVVTDVRNSTNAIATGLHKTVNFVAATSIASLKNMCAPTPVPFLFGGDGAVIMIPPGRTFEARQVLARLRGMIRREFNLELAVGCVSMTELRAAGGDVLVGRYEPTPGNNFGVFAGGGVSLLERTIKGKGDPQLQTAAFIADELDDGAAVDLSGLSCRWDELRSVHGKMLSLIIISAQSVQRDIYLDVQRLASENSGTRPVRMETLRTSWPPDGYRLEARARHKRGPLWATTVKVLAETLLAHGSVTTSRVLGKFNPVAYKEEIITNTDFCRYDDSLFFVMDCRTQSLPGIVQYLQQRAATGAIRFGLHVSDTALMTCLVTSWSDHLHVHFVDGANGGYTKAAELLKGNITLDQVLAATARPDKTAH
jgi:hypothetical protein